MKKRHKDRCQYVVFRIMERDLDPDHVTHTLKITPKSYCRRGVMKGANNKIILDRNGKPKRHSYGQWNLEANVHGNSGLIRQLQNILDQLETCRPALKRILKTAKADLTIAVEPSDEVCVSWYQIPAELINGFASLGIDIIFSVHIPGKMDEFWESVEQKDKQAVQTGSNNLAGC